MMLLIFILVITLIAALLKMSEMNAKNKRLEQDNHVQAMRINRLEWDLETTYSELRITCIENNIPCFRRRNNRVIRSVSHAQTTHA